MVSTGAKWLEIPVIYFAIGLAFGLFLHYTIELQWKVTNAHLNVVGWLSTGLIGVIFSIYKEAAETTFAKAQFWLYNIGLPFFFAGMMMIYLNVPRGLLEFCVSGGSIAVALFLLLFVINVFKHVKSTF